MPNAWIGIESGLGRIEHLSKHERAPIPILFHHVFTALYPKFPSSVGEEALHGLVHLGEEYVHGLVPVLDLDLDNRVRVCIPAAVEVDVDIGRSDRVGGVEEVVVGELDIVGPGLIALFGSVVAHEEGDVLYACC
jgi:hypothetical protein